MEASPGKLPFKAKKPQMIKMNVSMMVTPFKIKSYHKTARLEIG